MLVSRLPHLAQIVLLYPVGSWGGGGEGGSQPAGKRHFLLAHLKDGTPADFDCHPHRIKDENEVFTLCDGRRTWRRWIYLYIFLAPCSPALNGSLIIDQAHATPPTPLPLDGLGCSVSLIINTACQAPNETCKWKVHTRRDNLWKSSPVSVTWG